MKIKILYISLALIEVCGILFGIFYLIYNSREKTFPIEELADYVQPVVFLGSRETGETYVITLDEPDKKYNLEYSTIWDSWPETESFLFSQISDEKESICRYDMGKKEYELLLTEDMVCEYLESEQETGFDSVYYYFGEDVFSFVYGDNLLIYDADAEEFVFRSPLLLDEYEKVYDWKTPQTFLMGGFQGTYKAYEVSISNGNLERAELPDTDIGYRIVLTADGSMGCSHGSGYIEGIVFSPVLVWDTETYTVIRSKQGTTTSARLQLSYDNKYVLLARKSVNEPYQVLCLKVEDDSLCEVYAFDEDEYIVDVLWWSE